jgi:nucleoside-diphosphate-sugar epimerase
MPTAFITGATGFLGRHMVEVLKENDWTIFALCRRAANTKFLKSAGVSICEGSLDDDHSIADAMPEGCDAVFHMAADTSVWRGDRARQTRTNVDGTANIVKAAMAKGIGRFIHTSTIAVYGHHQGVITESSPRLGLNSRVNYARTKTAAENLVRDAVGGGLDAVILNPGHVIGRYDRKNWAAMFFVIKRDQLNGVPPGKGSFANGREVARAHLAAYERGGRGENYLLGGPYHSFLDLVGEVGRLLGKKTPDKTSPAIIIRAIARLQDTLAYITRKQPPLTPDVADFLCSDDHMDSSKAISALSYQEVPLRESLAECFGWLKGKDLL